MLINTARVQTAIEFASEKHGKKNQMRANQLPYIAHPYAVMSIVQRAPDDYGAHFEDALCVAMLHDTIEDTDTSLDELRRVFGNAVGYAVYALTKDKSIPDKLDQLLDSLRRALTVGPWVVGIKCADRVENLSFVTIPESWDRNKRVSYVHKEAPMILDWGRKAGMNQTCDRLAHAMRVYEHYIPPV